jgi:hypothetical protein
MNPASIALAIAAALGTGTIVAVINAISQRRKVGADANKADADATTMVIAAARELVDPLRRELALEREQHSRELALERRRVGEVRDELDAALRDAQALRGELAMARIEADELRREREQYREKSRVQLRRIRELEDQAQR